MIPNTHLIRDSTIEEQPQANTMIVENSEPLQEQMIVDGNSDMFHGAIMKGQFPEKNFGKRN